jgi:hypothetical protein
MTKFSVNINSGFIINSRSNSYIVESGKQIAANIKGVALINNHLAGDGLDLAGKTFSVNSDYINSLISNNGGVTANTIARHSHTNKTLLDDITSGGDGGSYLANDGTYKAIATNDQSLNTTDDVTFNSVNSTDGYKINSACVLSASGTNNVWAGTNSGSSNLGANNTGIGIESGQFNSGNYNLFMGYQAGKNNNDSNCVFIGYQAGLNNQGSDIIAIGYQAALKCVSNNNIAIGRRSLTSAQYAAGNIAIGIESGNSITSGSDYNTMIGYQAGKNLVSGDRNVFIGFKAGYNETGNEKLYIAKGSDTDDNWIYGDVAGGNHRVGVNTITLTEALTVNGSIDITSGNVYKINNTQVLTSQQPAIADLASGATLADTITKVNDILAVLRTHGLIAT